MLPPLFATCRIVTSEKAMIPTGVPMHPGQMLSAKTIHVRPWFVLLLVLGGRCAAATIDPPCPSASEPPPPAFMPGNPVRPSVAATNSAPLCRDRASPTADSIPRRLPPATEPLTSARDVKQPVRRFPVAEPPIALASATLELLPPTGSAPPATPSRPFPAVAGDAAAAPPRTTIGAPPLPTRPAGAPDLSAWWDSVIGSPLRRSQQAKPISIASLIGAALAFSSRVQVLSASPLISDTAIIEADAEFDWAAFVETSWKDIDEPVGNTLTTGGPTRFLDENARYRLGGRHKLGTGGQFEMGQEYGYQRSNSLFFVPNDQGTARLTLNFTQPLLRGAGRPYNYSTIVLAQLQSGMARDQFSRELQTHLLEITQAYWALYRDRGALLQRQRLLARGERILRDLELRQELDTVASQIVRARAAVAARQSNLFRAAADVKNSEGRIRTLVNAPDLGLIDEFELTPLDAPALFEVPIDMAQAIQTSFQNRPEVAQSLKEIRGGGVRLDVAKNELLPVLDLFAETYVKGLRGNSDIGGAWQDQFLEGAPSYTTGLRFEMPLRNRASRARFQRQAIELRQHQQQLQNTLQVLQLEVEIAVRDAITAFREIRAKHQSMRAAEVEVDFLTQRWTLLPGDDRSVSLLLEDLLNAHERLAAQEFGFLDAQVQYNVALVLLRKATGTLLQFERVTVTKAEWDGIPQLELQRQDVAGFTVPPDGRDASAAKQQP